MLFSCDATKEETDKLIGRWLEDPPTQAFHDDEQIDLTFFDDGNFNLTITDYMYNQTSSSWEFYQTRTSTDARNMYSQDGHFIDYSLYMDNELEEGAIYTEFRSKDLLIFDMDVFSGSSTSIEGTWTNDDDGETVEWIISTTGITINYYYQSPTPYFTESYSLVPDGNDFYQFVDGDTVWYYYKIVIRNGDLMVIDPYDFETLKKQD